MTYVANSLLNPAIYALRIPGFREDLVQVFAVLTTVSPQSICYFGSQEHLT